MFAKLIAEFSYQKYFRSVLLSSVETDPAIANTKTQEVEGKGSAKLSALR